MSALRRRAVLAVFVAAHLVGNLIAVPVYRHVGLGELDALTLLAVQGPLLGVLLGQHAMLAAYAAWGTGHWCGRLLVYAFCTLLLWYTVALGASAAAWHFDLPLILAEVQLVLFVFLPVPYGLMRAVWGWRFRVESEGPAEAAGRTRQFTIRRLLIWTAMAAIAVAIVQSPIGREVVAALGHIDLQDTLIIAGASVIDGGFGLLIAVPAVWGVLADRDRRMPAVRRAGTRWGRIVLEGVFRSHRFPVWLVAYTLLIAAAESWTLFALFEFRVWDAVFGVNLGLLLHVLASSALLRACGVRLSAASAAATA